MHLIYCCPDQENLSITLLPYSKGDYNMLKSQLMLCNKNLINNYILSYLEIHSNHVSQLASYQAYYGFILLILHKIHNYKLSSCMALEVIFNNVRALSVYRWLGYVIVQQRKEYYSVVSCGLQLINYQSKGKNFWRRLLLLNY
jgi:hypothetical protein